MGYVIDFIRSICNFRELYCIDGVVIAANALRPFQIYCVLPNLGVTRTWICRLNFAQRPIFSTSLKSQTQDPQLKVAPGELCSGFLRPEKIHRPQPGLNPRSWISRRARYPETPRPTKCNFTYNIYLLLNKINQQSKKFVLF